MYEGLDLSLGAVWGVAQDLVCEDQEMHLGHRGVHNGLQDFLHMNIYVE